jgi:hypothetical protein
MLKKKLVPLSSGKSVRKPLGGKTSMMPKKRHEEELDEDEESNIDEDEESDESEAEEETEVVTKQARRKLTRREEPEEEEEESEPAPKRKGLVSKGKQATSKKSPLERAFANVPASGDTIIKPGRYDMIVKEITLQPFVQGKGQKARAKFIVCDADYAESPVTFWYNLIGKDGEPNEWGIQIFRTEMAKLGYEVGTEVTEEEIEEMFDEITKERPGIVAKLSYREWNGRDLAVIDIQGESDSEEIQEYRDNIPF